MAFAQGRAALVTSEVNRTVSYAQRPAELQTLQLLIEPYRLHIGQPRYSRSRLVFGTKIDFARLFIISVIHISPRVSSPGKNTSSIRGQLWHKTNSRSLLKTTDRQLNEPCNCGRAHYGNEPVGLRQLMVRSASGNGIAVGIMIRVIDIVVGIMSRVIDIVVGIMSRVIGTVMPFLANQWFALLFPRQPQKWGALWGEIRVCKCLIFWAWIRSEYSSICFACCKKCTLLIFAFSVDSASFVLSSSSCVFSKSDFVLVRFGRFCFSLG